MKLFRYERRAKAPRILRELPTFVYDLRRNKKTDYHELLLAKIQSMRLTLTLQFVFGSYYLPVACSVVGQNFVSYHETILQVQCVCTSPM